MALGEHGGTRGLGAIVAAPHVGVGEEERLQLRDAVFAWRVEVFAVLLQRALQPSEGDVDSTVVSRVFAEREFTVLLYPRFGDVLGVLVGDALASTFVRLRVGRSPPVFQIAIGVEL